MRLACLVALLLAIPLSGCHSPLHTPGVCGFSDTLWDTYCGGDPGCCGGAGGGCLSGSCGCSQGCNDVGCNDGGCTRGGCSMSSCGSGGCGGCFSQDGTCPNCGVGGAMCSSGCRACGMSLGGGQSVAGTRGMAVARTNGGIGMRGPRRALGVPRQVVSAVAHCQAVQNVVHNAHRHCANGLCNGGAVGPEYGAVTYPYYTTRGPRDFFLKNPSSIGP